MVVTRERGVRISPPRQRRRRPIFVDSMNPQRGMRVVIKVVLRGMLVLLYRIQAVVLGVVAVGALLEVLIDLLRVLVDVNGYDAVLGMLLSLLLCILGVDGHPIDHEILVG